MSEQHLDCLSFATGGFIFRCSDLRAGDIARVFVDIARNFSRHHVGTTTGFEIARAALFYCASIKARPRGGDAGSRLGKVAAKLKQMPAGRAGVTIAFGIESKVRARECAVRAGGFVERRECAA